MKNSLRLSNSVSSVLLDIATLASAVITEAKMTKAEKACVSDIFHIETSVEIYNPVIPYNTKIPLSILPVSSSLPHRVHTIIIYFYIWRDHEKRDSIFLSSSYQPERHTMAKARNTEGRTIQKGPSIEELRTKYGIKNSGSDVKTTEPVKEPETLEERLVALIAKWEKEHHSFACQDNVHAAKKARELRARIDALKNLHFALPGHVSTGAGKVGSHCFSKRPPSKPGFFWVVYPGDKGLAVIRVDSGHGPGALVCYGFPHKGDAVRFDGYINDIGFLFSTEPLAEPEPREETPS
jgi:hypothetical protein